MCLWDIVSLHQHPKDKRDAGLLVRSKVQPAGATCLARFQLVLLGTKARAASRQSAAVAMVKLEPIDLFATWIMDGVAHRAVTSNCE